MEILTARPADMPYSEYRDHMRRQAKWLKTRLRGRLVYKSSEMVDFDVATGRYKMIRRYPPFVGRTRDLKPI